MKLGGILLFVSVVGAMHGCDGKSHSLGRSAASAGTGSGGESGAEQEPGGESGAGGSGGSGGSGGKLGGAAGRAGSTGNESGAGGSGGTGGVLDGEAGEPATAGRGGSSAAASGQGGSSGAAAGMAGTAGAAGAETWTVRKFIDAQWAALCHVLFQCTGDSDEAGGFRALYGPEARCVELVTQGPNGYTGVADLIQTVDEGRAILMPEHIPACLEALARCDYFVNEQPSDEACRRVFAGTKQTGETCYREEECAGGGQCHVVDTCPGICEPRRAIGEECGYYLGDCDESDGLVGCFSQEDFMGPSTCHAVTVLPPPGEGEPCWTYFSADHDFAPCAEGMWCQGDGYKTGGLEPQVGICRGGPIPGGAPCLYDEDICEEGYLCDGVVCTPFAMVGDGEPCGATRFCDIFEGLDCVEGYCQRVGDGTEGSPCLPWENVGFVACNPGLVCVTSIDPITFQIVSRTCLPPLAAGEPCMDDVECASEACNLDSVCEPRFCEKANFGP